MTRSFLEILPIAKAAGEIVLRHYHKNEPDTSVKHNDFSLVTDADIASNHYITGQLQQKYPEISIVSEEHSMEENHKAIRNSICFVIDPLDGTHSFARKKGEFTINIAIIQNQKPIFGVIYSPLSENLYYTDSGKAYKNGERIQARKERPKDGGVAIATHRQPERGLIMKELENKKFCQFIDVSSSLKFCLIAEGIADYYPRRVNIRLWDIAAGHAIAEAAGAKMLKPDGQEILYDGESDFWAPYFDVKAGDW